MAFCDFFSKSANNEWQNPGSLTLCLQNPKTVNQVKGHHQAGSLGPQRTLQGQSSAWWSVPDILLQHGPTRGHGRMRKLCGPSWCPKPFPAHSRGVFDLSWRICLSFEWTSEAGECGNLAFHGGEWMEKQWDRVSVRETRVWGLVLGFSCAPNLQGQISAHEAAAWLSGFQGWQLHERTSQSTACETLCKLELKEYCF